MNMIHMILCGGVGTRLWPLSRESKPKQFMNFLDSKSLFQKTALGNKSVCDECVIVCNNEHYHMASSQMSEASIKPIRYILEPIPKNTAAAVCLGLQEIDLETIVLVTPADHYIDYSEAYFSAICQAQDYAEQGFISIFGIKPSRPETGFGYIEVTDQSFVRHFHEKPNLKTAEDYLKQGNFYWNSGMVCAKAGILLKAMQNYAPDILSTAQEAYKEADIITDSISPIYRIFEKHMQNIPTISLDHALLEKIESLRCVLTSFSWSDIGSFDSIFTHFPKDHSGNGVDTKNYIPINSKNNLIMGNHRTISTIDMEDLVVIDTPDALLISRLGSTQKVRDVVHELKASNSQLYKSHVENQRPWGYFTVLETQETYKVKRIVVFPGKRLSLQKHLYRSEHWIIIEGTALVTLGEATRTLVTNQSIFIPQEEIHRVENLGSSDLVFIEVQYGCYTGEDDIIRLQDDFFRVANETTIETNSLMESLNV